MKILVFFIFFLAVVTLITCHKSENVEDIPKIISTEVAKYKTHKTHSHKLTDAIKSLSKIKGKKLYDELFCEVCEVVVGQVIHYRKIGSNKDSMVVFLQKLCNLFSGWGAVACTGYINIEIDTVLYIIDNKSNLTGARICSIYFQINNCPDPQAHDWVIPLPSRHQHTHARSRHAPDAPLKILHLTDFHYDPLYKPGSNADCDLPLCCESSNGIPTNASKAAGYWGDYRVCDTPWHSLIDLMNRVNVSKFDYIYYTGDIISHRSWATTKDHNVQAIHDIFQLLKDSFNKTQIYPILGNHEPHPTDFYSPGEVVDNRISTKWLFELAGQQWATWLPNTTATTILQGGFYTVSVKKGFRIVALNSNVCYISNLWLLYEDKDPYGQLAWLVDILKQAEKNGEKVHILSHIPPGEIQCLKQWSLQYRRIVERFAPTIIAQFNGHTHLDELRLFPSPNTKKIVNVAYNAGSFTTFVGLNPNYRIYDVSPSNYSVLDYHHYTYNLTKANQNQTVNPEWYKLYSFKEAYGLANTTLDSLANLATRITKNHTLTYQYFRFQLRDSPLVKSGCKEQCLTKLACTITAVDAADSIKCQNLKKPPKH